MEHLQRTLSMLEAFDVAVSEVHSVSSALKLMAQPLKLKFKRVRDLLHVEL